MASFNFEPGIAVEMRLFEPADAMGKGQRLADAIKSQHEGAPQRLIDFKTYGMSAGLNALRVEIDRHVTRAVVKTLHQVSHLRLRQGYEEQSVIRSIVSEDRAKR